MPQSDVVVAVDVGGTTIKAATVDADTRLLDTSHCVTPAAAQVVDAVCGQIALLRGRATADVRGVGLVLPGIVDAARGIARYSANIGWRDLPIRDLVAERTGLPVGIEHDVRAAGLAEAERGAARRSNNTLYVAIGTGIAAATIAGGTVLTGATNQAGELGHLPVYPDGEPCACGQRGCTETYASAAALPRRYAAAGGDPAVRDAPGVIARATAGEPAARRVFDEAVTALGRALVTATLLLDPELIVLGGGLSLAGPALLEPVAASLAGGLAWRDAPDLVGARFGADSGRVGAALVGRRAVTAQ